MARETLYDDFLAFERRHNLFPSGDGVVAAVSGGPDSVALLDILRQFSSGGRIRLAACHLNHQLRGAEADDDERFVESLCDSMGVPLEVGRRDVAALAREKSLSVEAAARDARYAFFNKAVRKHNARHVATAHTMSDQAETVVQRILEGAGPEGLTGIPLKRTLGKWTDIKVARPLLFATRERIMDYLAGRGLSSRTDSTNLEPVYLRNRIRLELLPRLREFNPSIEDALARIAESMDLVYDFLWREVDDHWHRVVSWNKPPIFSLRRHALLRVHGAIAREIVKGVLTNAGLPERDLKAAHIEAVLALAESRKPSARVELPAGFVVRREYDDIFVGRATEFADESMPAAETANDEGFEEILEVNGRVDLPAGGFIDSMVENDEYMDDESREQLIKSAAGDEAAMDMQNIELPLAVRYPRPGDRFRPLGCRGEKKLSDVFINAKIPADQRATIPLICDRSGIVWVAGYRIAEHVRVGGLTTRYVLVSWRRPEKS
jgi:tRNA(Ile)-lysidine synthase